MAASRATMHHLKASGQSFGLSGSPLGSKSTSNGGDPLPRAPSRVLRPVPWSAMEAGPRPLPISGWISSGLMMASMLGLGAVRGLAAYRGGMEGEEKERTASGNRTRARSRRRGKTARTHVHRPPRPRPMDRPPFKNAVTATPTHFRTLLINGPFWRRPCANFYLNFFFFRLRAFRSTRAQPTATAGPRVLVQVGLMQVPEATCSRQGCVHLQICSRPA